MMRVGRGIVLGLAFAAWFVAAPPERAVAQCAMCRRALESPEARALAAAYREGIWLLFAAPFVTFGAVALAVWRLRGAVCRAERPAVRNSRAIGARWSWHRAHGARASGGSCRFSGSAASSQQNPA